MTENIKRKISQPYGFGALLGGLIAVAGVFLLFILA